MPRFVHESFRFLASKGRVDEAVAVLRKIAKTNGKDVDEEVYGSFRVRPDRGPFFVSKPSRFFF